MYMLVIVTTNTLRRNHYRCCDGHPNIALSTPFLENSWLITLCFKIPCKIHVDTESGEFLK